MTIFIRINLHDLGMFKEKRWEFKQEWRFRILAFPDDEITKETLDLETYPTIDKFIDVNLGSGNF